MSERLHLTMSCDSYDRVQALIDGSVKPEGIDLTFLANTGAETFWRMLRYKEFDVAEMSLSSYVATLFSEDPAFIAIPVFPSRVMRHSCIQINSEGSVKTPKDLIGKRVGLPEWQVTAAVWIKGFLQDEYGVPVESIKYFTGGVEDPGREEKIPLSLPEKFSLTVIDPRRTLAQMLEDGEIDALYFTVLKNYKHIKRLFENYAEVEQEYYKRTKLFHIMHTVVIRRDLYEKFPWVAQSMMKALTAAKDKAFKEMYSLGRLKIMLPWLNDHIDRTRDLMGEDYWPYGVEPNRHTLETFLRYSFEQGLSKRLLKPEEIFAPETIESYKF